MAALANFHITLSADYMYLGVLAIIILVLLVVEVRQWKNKYKNKKK